MQELSPVSVKTVLLIAVLMATGKKSEITAQGYERFPYKPVPFYIKAVDLKAIYCSRYCFFF